MYLRCGALDRLRPGILSTSSTPFLNDVFTKLLSDADVCEFDAVIIVDHPGVSFNEPSSSSILSTIKAKSPNLSIISKVTRIRPARTRLILVPRNSPTRFPLFHATPLRAPPTESSSELEPPPRARRQTSRALRRAAHRITPRQRRSSCRHPGALLPRDVRLFPVFLFLVVFF